MSLVQSRTLKVDEVVKSWKSRMVRMTEILTFVLLVRSEMLEVFRVEWFLVAAMCPCTLAVVVGANECRDETQLPGMSTALDKRLVEILNLNHVPLISILA